MKDFIIHFIVISYFFLDLQWHCSGCFDRQHQNALIQKGGGEGRSSLIGIHESFLALSLPFYSVRFGFLLLVISSTFIGLFHSDWSSGGFEFSRVAL
jgi:hypothetical protein